MSVEVFASEDEPMDGFMVTASVEDLVDSFKRWNSEKISVRTKAAMAAAKARGRVFGRPESLTPEARLKGALKAAATRCARAADAYADLLPMIRDLRASGATLDAIADHLNASG